MKGFKYVVLFFLLQACVNQSPLPLVEVSKVEEIDQFSDTTFFSQITSMYFVDRHIFLSDYKRNQILEIAPMDMVINTIGNQGKGPGELLGAASLFVKDDTIYIVNEFQQRFDVFYQSRYLKSIRPGDRINGQLRFSVVDENIIYSSRGKEYTMSIFNTKNDSVIRIGNKSPLENKYSGRHVWTDSNYIYSISQTQPIIERFSLKGDFIDQYDYRDIEPVKTIMQYIDRQPLAENSYYGLVADAYLAQNKLYLLIANHNDENKTCNTILTIDVNKMEAVKLYMLKEKDGWFGAFCVYNNDLYIVNETLARIAKFQLP